MARVPSVTNISKDTSTPDHRTLDIDDNAGVLDVDADIPDDFNWDAVPDDDDPMPYSDDDDLQPQPPQQQQRQNGHVVTPSTRSSQPSDSHSQSHTRSDGVVADPMGPHRLEAGEVDQKKFFKKKKKRKSNVEWLRCDVCDVSVASQVTMDSHLKGQRHMAKARQAALKVRNNKIALETKLVQSQNKPPVEPRRPEDDWDSTNSPPRPVSKPSSTAASSTKAAHLSGRKNATPERRGPSLANHIERSTAVRSQVRDPYAKNDLDRGTERTSEIRDPYAKNNHGIGADVGSEARDPAAKHDRDIRMEVRSSEQRDPYAKNNRDSSAEDRSEARDPDTSNDRNNGMELGSEGRDPYASNNRDRKREVGPEGRDPCVTNNRNRGSEVARDDRASGVRVRGPRITARGPRLNRQASEVPGSEGNGRERDAGVRPGRDPYNLERGQEASNQRLSGDSSKNQDNGLQIQTDAAEPKKRKRAEGITEPGPVEGDRYALTGDRERLQGYGGNSALRRRLSDGAQGPGLGDPYASRDSPGQSKPATAKPATAKPPPPPPPPPLVSAPPPLVSVPPPLLSSPAPVPSGTRDDRRPLDQTRRFTYGSVRREAIDDGCTVIPYEWLAQPMDTMEWRDLRHNTFTKGNDVDRLAFKMLQEILLSPVLGVSSQALTPFSRSMMAAVRNQLLSPDNEAFAKFDDFPEALSVRDENYARADPEWQRTQTAEQMAVRLVGDNIVFSLNSYEDSEAAQSTEPHNFPRRGSFGQNNMTKSTRDGGIAPRYPDSVQRDDLFNELYDHLLRKNMTG